MTRCPGNATDMRLRELRLNPPAHTAFSIASWIESKCDAILVQKTSESDQPRVMSVNLMDATMCGLWSVINVKC